MNVDNIKGAICKYFNERMDIKFIKSPTNASAPKGNYIAVGCIMVEQPCEALYAPAGGEVFEQVATIKITEVEGSGDNLRKVRNAMQGSDFIAYAKANDFTVWDLGSIMAIDTYDGEFYVRQWRFTARMNFEDVNDRNPIKIETVNPLTLEEYNG